MIEINKNFSYETDQYNWTLYQWFDGKNKKGEKIRTSKKTYHSTLGNMLVAVIDKTLKTSNDFNKLVEISKCLTDDLTKVGN